MYVRYSGGRGGGVIIRIMVNVKYVCLNICSDSMHAFFDFIVGFWG